MARDGLQRSVPTATEVGPPRPGRTVGLFYFLWHGAHAQGGPYDIHRILQQDPDAMDKPDSPLWGPLMVPHHWGEPLFGHYRTTDRWVLRKHAQMLGDAGVDVVIFDVTNGFTYLDEVRALLDEWAQVRALGNRTPQVAFLAPFWKPSSVARDLWRAVYAPGLHRELWFEWEGKPLLLADPERLALAGENAHQDHPAELRPGHTLGQAFTADRALTSVGGRFPTWGTTGSGVTLELRRDGPDGSVLATRRFEQVQDNAWLQLPLDPPAPPGRYCLTASASSGRIGWWSHRQDLFPGGAALADGQPVPGDRTLRWTWQDATLDAILESFTFRKPQPDYFRGPTEPDMWSWLEVAPQHVFRNRAGVKEQMSAGVAQNAVDGRLGSMSEPGARGRSFHGGRRDARPDAVRWGLNLEEQWANVLREDPRFVFVTGWNEWIAGRFAEFNGVRRPVMFVDQFDQEHSRDIEPMRGGHGDDYFLQLVGLVRRYKGARPHLRLRPASIQVDGRFEDWTEVEPEFLDTVGDVALRRHAGWNLSITYTNTTGRNDLVSAKVSWDPLAARFLARTRAPLVAPGIADGLFLFLDSDGDSRTGWLGFDHVVNRRPVGPGRTRVERHRGPGYTWETVGEADIVTGDDGVEIGLDWAVLGLAGPPPYLDFKWADNLRETGDWDDFTLHGDSAPNDRFCYRIVR